MKYGDEGKAELIGSISNSTANKIGVNPYVSISITYHFWQVYSWWWTSLQNYSFFSELAATETFVEDVISYGVVINVVLFCVAAVHNQQLHNQELIELDTIVFFLDLIHQLCYPQLIWILFLFFSFSRFYCLFPFWYPSNPILTVVRNISGTLRPYSKSPKYIRKNYLYIKKIQTTKQQWL